MAKQTINIGSTANDGTGSSLRAAGDLVNDNFNEIYTTFGNGSTLTAPVTAVSTTTLTGKTIDLDANTLTGTLAEFNTALQGDSFVSLTGSETLTNKTLTTATLTNPILSGSPGIMTGGDMLFDASSDIILDAAGKDIIFRYDGNQFALFTASGTDLLIQSGTTTALTFSGANATMAGNVTLANNKKVIFGDAGEYISGDGTDLNVVSSGDIILDADGGDVMLKDGGSTFATFTNTGLVISNMTVNGTLTVNGTTTTVNSTNTAITDNLFELNSGASSNANDTGIIMERGSTGDNAIVAWDESEDKFVMGTTTATASDTGNLSITTGTLVANIEGNLTGNVTGNVSGSAGSVTGNAATTTALATGRTIGMTGDVVWTSASFDGSANVTGVAALQANTVTSTELASAVQLDIIDSSGSVQKTLYGAGS
tara:strand:+ start:200 stop:1480 length:1281 start_codon:yes stop_codon:yes gene_type:complete